MADFKNNMLSKGDVEKVIVVNKETVEVYIKPSKIGTGRYIDNTSGGFFKQQKPNFLFKIGSVESFEKQMAEAQEGIPETEKTPIVYETRENHIGTLSCISSNSNNCLYDINYATYECTVRGKFNIGKSKAMLLIKIIT